MLKITKHCQERYAERIMGCDEKITANIYIAQNEKLIEERINKMYDYGKKIYEGRTKEDGSFVHIFFSSPWILLTDRKEEVAITLYKIEAVREETDEDEEVNRLFIDTRIKKLEGIQSQIDEEQARQQEESKQFRDEIESNKEEIRRHEDMIVALRKRNEGLQQSLEYGSARLKEYEERYRHVIEELVGVKILKRG